MWKLGQFALLLILLTLDSGCSVMVVSGSANSNSGNNKLLLDCPGPDENPVISAKGSGSGGESGSGSGGGARGSVFSGSGSGISITSGGGSGSGGFSSSGEIGDKSDEAWDRFRPMLLKCKASYPITWDFLGSKPPDLSVETVVEVDNVLNPKKRCFYSNLKVLASGYTGKESRTGNYTCKSFDGLKKSSIYRFAHDGTSIFNTKKTMDAKIIVRGGVAQVFIPCTANVPNLNATVLRIQNEDKNVTFVALDASIVEQKYDPKVGFFLRSKNTTALTGKFVCSGTYRNETEVVEITVAPPTDYIVSPTNQYLTFRNSRISVSCRSNEPVEMRLNNTNVKVQQHLQEVMYKSDGFRFGAVAEVFTHPKQDVLRGDINCVKKSTGEVLYSWKYDTDYQCTCTWNLKPDLFKTTRFFFLLDRTLRGTIRAFGLNTEGDSYYMNLPTPRGELSCTSPKSAKVNMTYIACENPVECQIKSAFLKWFDFDHRAYAHESAFSDEEGEDAGNQTTISQGYIRSGIIKCGVQDYITTKIAIANLDTLFIDSIPTKNLVRIIAPENNVFVGDKMLFTCIYEKFQIAREAKFAFQYKNGTINVLDIEKLDDRYSFDLEKYQRTSYITIDSPDISSLLCYVPIWNSTEWKNTSLPLNVSTALPVASDSSKNCPTDSSPIIILQRNSTISSRRVRVPHLVSNSTISLYNPVSEIQLICRANYPVQWVYNDVPLNTSKIGKVPCSMTSSMKKVYEAILHIDPLKKEGTGNYSCRKTFAFHPQSFVYIYAVGDGEATFVNEGRHMQVVKHTDEPNSKVVLPCQVSNPDAKPYLFLDHEDSEKIQRLEFSNELNYDPRSGFELDLSLAPEAVTTFICSMSENASSFGVLITLRKQDGIYAAGASGSGPYKGGESQSHGMLIGITVILLILVIVLASGLFLMYKKCQEATSKTADVSPMGNTGFSSYDDVRIQADDRENIVGDGTYNRFN